MFINFTHQRKRASWAIPHMEMNESRSCLFFFYRIADVCSGNGRRIRTGSRFTEYNSWNAAPNENPKNYAYNRTLPIL